MTEPKRRQRVETAPPFFATPEPTRRTAVIPVAENRIPVPLLTVRLAENGSRSHDKSTI